MYRNEIPPFFTLILSQNICNATTHFQNGRSIGNTPVLQTNGEQIDIKRDGQDTNLLSLFT